MSLRSATAGRRACAVLAASSAVLHGLMVDAAGNPMVSVVVVGMAVACLYCARELWVAGSLRVWCVVAVMNLCMVAVHWSVPGHHHGGTTTVPTGTAMPMSALMTVATTISIVEAAVATAVLYVQTRRRAVSLAAQWN